MKAKKPLIIGLKLIPLKFKNKIINMKNCKR